MSIRSFLAGVVVGLGVLLVAAGGAQATPVGPTVPLTPQSQENAIRTAKDYLDMAGYSRSGLIKQLQYEGYSAADATYAVDSLGVDWNAQAVRTAQDYLDMSGYSHSGLVKQLMYEGYTAAQAEYGVSAVGL